MEKKRFLNHLLKALNNKISIETSQFMLILNLKLRLTSFKQKFPQKQLTLQNLYASGCAQPGNPDKS